MMVLSIGRVNLPHISYLSLLYWVRSLNFSILISETLAPSSLELMLLPSLVAAEVRCCFDIYII